MKDVVTNMWPGKLTEYPTGFGDLFFQAVKV